MKDFCSQVFLYVFHTLFPFQFFNFLSTKYVCIEAREEHGINRNVYTTVIKDEVAKFSFMSFRKLNLWQKKATTSTSLR